MSDNLSRGTATRRKRQAGAQVEHDHGEPVCAHGHVRRDDGSCLLDALHPAVPCLTCGANVCACGTCAADHLETTGHPLAVDRGEYGPQPRVRTVVGT